MEFPWRRVIALAVIAVTAGIAVTAVIALAVTAVRAWQPRANTPTFTPTMQVYAQRFETSLKLPLDESESSLAQFLNRQVNRPKDIMYTPYDNDSTLGARLLYSLIVDADDHVQSHGIDEQQLQELSKWCKIEGLILIVIEKEEKCIKDSQKIAMWLEKHLPGSPNYSFLCYWNLPKGPANMFAQVEPDAFTKRSIKDLHEKLRKRTYV